MTCDWAGVTCDWAVVTCDWAGVTCDWAGASTSMGLWGFWLSDLWCGKTCLACSTCICIGTGGASDFCIDEVSLCKSFKLPPIMPFPFLSGF